MLGLHLINRGVSLLPTYCFSVHPVPSNLLPPPHPTHRQHQHPPTPPPPQTVLCCVSKKKCATSAVPWDLLPPHIKAASFSLNVNIKSVDHKSQHSLHKLPLPQPLILPSDEGERGRGVTARGSYGGRERWRERDGDREREREIQQKQLLASEI